MTFMKIVQRLNIGENDRGLEYYTTDLVYCISQVKWLAKKVVPLYYIDLPYKNT